MVRVSGGLSYQVKNTRVEFSGVVAEGDHRGARLKLSDATGATSSSPYEECLEHHGLEHHGDCEGNSPGKSYLAAPLHLVPNTPSPFLHPAAMDAAVLHGLHAMGFGGSGGDMLPPAYGDGSEFAMGMHGAFDGQDMGGFYGMPTMMYDPASNSYTSCGCWMPMDSQQGSMGGCEMVEVDGVLEEHPSEHDPSGMHTPGHGHRWCPEIGMLLNGQGCPLKEGPPEAAQAWGAEGGMVMEQGGEMMMEMVQDGQGWAADGGMPMDQACGMGDALMDGRGWNAEMDQGGGGQGWSDNGHGWGPDGQCDESMAMEAIGADPPQEAQHQDWNGGVAAEGTAMGRSNGSLDGRSLAPQQQSRSSKEAHSDGAGAGGWGEGESSGWRGSAKAEKRLREREREKERKLEKQQQRKEQQREKEQQAWDQHKEQQPPKDQLQNHKEKPPKEHQQQKHWQKKEAEEQDRNLKDEMEKVSLQKDLEDVETGSGSEATPAHSETQRSSSDVATTTGGYTTVMLRNIPNKYTREMLVKQLSQDFKGRFDFVYLPIDFKNRCNVGYGFINFRNPEACDEFVIKFNGVDVRKCLPGLNSRKVAEVTPARVQGLDENVRRLRNGPVMNELVQHPDWMPLLLGDDGEERAFPVPDQPCPPVKPRRRNNGGREEHGGAVERTEREERSHRGGGGSRNRDW
mmetsp:Transcript_47494/g.136133  ORF Transcript_47494/g.136133 Transcript_47494/m.136133 type:complete len:682 (+) Transcript_47494:98-2143(+)